MKRLKCKIKKVLRNKSIKEQILLSMLVTSMMAAIVLGIILFVFSKRTIERNHKFAYEHNLQVSSSIVDIYMTNLINMSRTLLNNSSFKKALLAESETDAYFSSRNSLTLMSVLRELGDQSPNIQNITIVSNSGKLIFYSKLNNQGGKMQHYYRDGNILESDWVVAVDDAIGREVLYGDNVLFDDGNATFSLVKQLRNPEDGIAIGYVIFNIKKSMFKNVFGSGKEGYVTNSYMIIDDDKENAEMVYFSGDENAKEAILEDYSNGQQTQYLFSECYNSESGWKIVNVINRNELSRDSSYIGWITILICGLMLVVCIVAASGISGIITKPLAVLEKTIQFVGNGKLRVDAEFDESEIGRIGNQFKNLVNNNLELHEKLLNSVIREQEAELLLLQSRINPHFLYNTLDSLYFMAVIEQADDIAEMVLALSDTFKLSLNKGDKLIAVRDEIQKIEAYMKIQNMRYHNRFVLHIEVEEKMLNQKILTFILQPIVENAVCHGLEPKMGDDCSIRLEGCSREEHMVFRIIDNGVGIDDFTNLDKGYGIRNVKERIYLFYGGEGALIFNSWRGEGTEVVIRIPIIRAETRKE